MGTTFINNVAGGGGGGSPFGGHGTLTTSLDRGFQAASLVDVTGTTDATIVGTVATTSAGMNSDNAWDGWSSSDYINTNFAVSTGAKSMSGWVYLVSSLPGATSFMGMGNVNGKHFYIGMSSNTKWAGGVINYLSTTLSGGASLTASAWNHVVITFDGSTTAKIYVNGIYAATSTVSESAANGFNLFLGVRNEDDTTTQYPMRSTDRLYSCYIWSKALSDGAASIGATAGGEVADLYNSGSGLLY